MFERRQHKLAARLALIRPTVIPLKERLPQEQPTVRGDPKP
jgi:hypothetical protein